jgi:hypothetical protein
MRSEATIKLGEFGLSAGEHQCPMDTSNYTVEYILMTFCSKIIFNCHVKII